MEYKWKRNTMVFLLGQAVSIFGSSLVQYAITWHITLTTQSGVYAMLAIVFGISPTFLLSPFAGVWADRYNRKVLIVVADAAIAGVTLLLAIAWMLGYGAIWLLFVALAARGLGSAVQSPCVSAMLPDIVPQQHLTKVNGFYGSAQSAITLLSPILSAALLGIAPLWGIFFIDVLTAVLAIAIMLFLLQLPKREKAPPQKSTYFKELKQGFMYIGRHKYLRNLCLLLSLYCFMAAPVAFLTPLQVTRNYGGEVWYLSAIEITFSIGMIVGGLLIAAWGGLKNRVRTMILAAFVMAGCTMGLGVSGIPLWVYLGFMGFFGAAMPILNTPATVMMQERVDPDYLGRIFGVITMINTSMMPLGMVVFGPLADTIPIEWILFGTGAIILLCAVLMMANKALLQAGKRVGAEAVPAGGGPQ